MDPRALPFRYVNLDGMTVDVAIGGPLALSTTVLHVTLTVPTGVTRTATAVFPFERDGATLTVNAPERPPMALDALSADELQHLRCALNSWLTDPANVTAFAQHVLRRTARDVKRTAPLLRSRVLMAAVAAHQLLDQITDDQADVTFAVLRADPSQDLDTAIAAARAATTP